MTTQTSRLMTLVSSLVPADLIPDVERSLRVPQYGPYHCDGPFMGSHLELILEALRDAADGKFHADVPEGVRPLMQRAATTFAHLAPLYLLLHDLDKATCLTLVYQDGTKQAVTWEEWQALLCTTDDGLLARQGDGEALTRFCQSLGLKQVSYYQETDSGTRTHGKVTAERLRGRSDVADIVVKAVETHEVAFQFGNKSGINIPLYEKTFGSWSEDEVGFALLVNYSDQAGSLDASGSPDVSDFVLLARMHVAVQQFIELKARLDTTPRLDSGKVTKTLDALRKATDAFQAEDVDAAYGRIVAECTIPTYEEPKLRGALQPLVDAGTLAGELVEPLISGLVATGQFPADVGRQLGKANGPVRAAVASSLR